MRANSNRCKWYVARASLVLIGFPSKHEPFEIVATHYGHGLPTRSQNKFKTSTMPLLRRHCGCVWWLVVVLVNVTLWLGRPVIVCSAAYETADPSNAIDVATSKREIITTAACASVGQASDYPARLDLTYMYSVEFYSDNNENASIDLNGMERAIATSVASTLSACSTDNQPQYAVELSSYSAHRFIDAGLGESDSGLLLNEAVVVRMEVAALKFHPITVSRHFSLFRLLTNSFSHSLLMSIRRKHVLQQSNQCGEQYTM